MGIGRTSMLLVAIMGLAALFVAALPERARVGGITPMFESDGAYFPCPDGWYGFDPFHPRVRRRGHGVLGELLAGRERVAFVCRIDRSTEAFLVRGNVAALDSDVANARARLASDPALQPARAGNVTAADGTAFEWQTFMGVAPDMPGGPVVRFFAVGSVAGQTCVVDGGGMVADFDLDGLLGIVRGLRLAGA